MTLNITFFGPRSHWWGSWKNRNDYGTIRSVPRYWYHPADKFSLPSVGFCIPFIHVSFSWGKEKRKK